MLAGTAALAIPAVHLCIGAVYDEMIAALQIILEPQRFTGIFALAYRDTFHVAHSEVAMIGGISRTTRVT